MIRRIRQIIPADGWVAVYDAFDGTQRRQRLAAWALVTTSYEADEREEETSAGEEDEVIAMQYSEMGRLEFAEYANLIDCVFPEDDMPM